VGTITERKLSDGGKRFLAQVGIKRDGKWVHRENRTFEHKRDAKLWARERDVEMAKPEFLKRIATKDPTLAFVIDAYAAARKRLGRTQEQVLRSIKTYPIAKLNAPRSPAKPFVASSTSFRLAALRRPSKII